MGSFCSKIFYPHPKQQRIIFIYLPDDSLFVIPELSASLELSAIIQTSYTPTKQ